MTDFCVQDTDFDSFLSIYPQNHCVWLPQRALQTRRRFRNKHLHLVCGHHQGGAHPLRLGGVGGGQFSGPQTPRDAGSGAAVVARRRRLTVGDGEGVWAEEFFFFCHTVKEQLESPLNPALSPRPGGERKARAPVMTQRSDTNPL